MWWSWWYVEKIKDQTKNYNNQVEHYLWTHTHNSSGSVNINVVVPFIFYSCLS